MFDVLSYIIKILFSVTSTYLLVFFYNKDTKIDFIDIIKYNFLCILVLSPIYQISIEHSSFIFYSLIILLLYMYIYQSIDSNLRFLYIFSLIIAILMACNYILYTLLGVALYIFFNTNIIDILHDDNQTFIDDNKNIDE